MLFIQVVDKEVRTTFPITGTRVTTALKAQKAPVGQDCFSCECFVLRYLFFLPRVKAYQVFSTHALSHAPFLESNMHIVMGK